MIVGPDKNHVGAEREGGRGGYCCSSCSDPNLCPRGCVDRVNVALSCSKVNDPVANCGRSRVRVSGVERPICRAGDLVQREKPVCIADVNPSIGYCQRVSDRDGAAWYYPPNRLSISLVESGNRPKKTLPLSTAGDEDKDAEGSVAFPHTTAPVLASRATNWPF